MIKDVIVWLDGGISDEWQLPARLPANSIARWSSDRSRSLAVVRPGRRGRQWRTGHGRAVGLAREAADKTEATLAKRLRQLHRPVEIRRFDILADDVVGVAAREARFAKRTTAVFGFGCACSTSGEGVRSRASGAVMRLKLDLTVDPENEEGRYLLACSRIRNVSPATLLRRIFRATLKHQLVRTILDDEEELRKLDGKTERKYSHAKISTATRRQQVS
jgi:hypothetical protein